jgi:hypothetical protein
MEIFDTLLITEIAALVVVTMQAIKAYPRVRGSAIPAISAIVGVVACLGWYAVTGQLLLADGIEWENMYRGIFNGICGAVAANAGYNIQKALPGVNILPTATEMDKQVIEETVAKTELVTYAVTEGVSPHMAKHAVGLPDDESPVLEHVPPTDVGDDGIELSVVSTARKG